MRKFTALLLIAGLGGNLLLPCSAKAQKTAFTQWLERSMESGGEELRNRLLQLPAESEGEIVSHWLFQQWNLHHQQSAGNDSVLPDATRQGAVWSHQKISRDQSGLHSTPQALHLAREFTQAANPAEATGRDFERVPFLSGISINAP
ncbi:MAG: hypothetical protein WDZ29_06325 [Balneolaceae bacterium]